MSEKAIVEIMNLVRARARLIVVLTPEERHFLDRFCEACAAPISNSRGAFQYRQVLGWSVSRGVEPIYPAAPAEGEKFAGVIKVDDGGSLADPSAALGWFLKNSLTEKDARVRNQPAVLVMRDLHPFLGGTGRPADPVVVRLLRDIVFNLGDTMRTVVLLQPALTLPDDLKSVARVVDYPLPTREELTEVVQAYAEQLGRTQGGKVKIDLGNGKLEAVVRALQGLTIDEADQALSIGVISTKELSEKIIPFILASKAAAIKNAIALEYFPESLNWSAVGGLDKLREWAEDADLSMSEAAREFGVEPPRGVLLVGVPGCGKSLAAKAIAGGRRPLIRLSMGAAMGSLLGQSEERIRQALKIAEAIAPCVLMLDEVEKLFGMRRGGGGESNGGTSDRILAEVLTWMQESKADVLIVATANEADGLDAALIRRFSTVFFVDSPAHNARKEIFRVHISQRGRNPDHYDLEKLAEATPDFTGSEIETVVKSALARAFKRGRDLQTGDMLEMIADTIPLAVTSADQIARMRSWATLARPASSEQTTGRQEVPAERFGMIEV